MDKNEIIDQIEEARKRNNSSWMRLLRIAMDKAPVETSLVLRDIHDGDAEISRLTKALMEKYP